MELNSMSRHLARNPGSSKVPVIVYVLPELVTP